MNSCWGLNVQGPLSTAPTQTKRDWGGGSRQRGFHLASMHWLWTGQRAVILGHITAWWRSGWVTQMEPGIDSPGIPQATPGFLSNNQVRLKVLLLFKVISMNEWMSEAWADSLILGAGSVLPWIIFLRIRRFKVWRLVGSPSCLFQANK